MLKLGIISELGTGKNKGFARVSFDENSIVSGWLALPSTNTKTAKHWITVGVNSQVACLMDHENEQGCIVMVLWSATDVPPDWATPDTLGVRYADGSEIYYDAKSHTLYINAPDAEINCTCKKINITGEVQIKGDTIIDGDTTISGDVTAKEFTAGIIKLTQHKHPTAATGSPSTPIP